MNCEDYMREFRFHTCCTISRRNFSWKRASL